MTPTPIDPARARRAATPDPDPEPLVEPLVEPGRDHVVDRSDDLTPEWLTAALRSTGLDVEVVDLDVTRIGSGQIGAAFRLELREVRGSGALPPTLVAKIAAGDPASRAMVAEGYRKEVGFYTELVDTVVLRTPRCWYGAISDDGTCFTLLLDDLHPAEPGVQVRGCTVEQAEMAVRNLAGLHGPRWCDATLLEMDWMPMATAADGEFLGEVFHGAIEPFTDALGHHLDEGDEALLHQIADQLGPWLGSHPDRFGLIHGDYRVDNLLFHPDEPLVWAVDWQTLGVGLPGRDVAYFLATALDPDERRAHERRLLHAYVEALGEHGVTLLDADQHLEDYRLGVLQAPLVTVLGAVYATAAPSAESDAMFGSMIRRGLLAVRDLRPFELL